MYTIIYKDKFQPIKISSKMYLFLFRESEDTMLLILKEIYGSTGIQTDAQLPALSLQVCPTPNSSTVYETDGLLHNPIMGIDPTAPVSEKLVGPPPKSGFVKKSWSKRNRFNFLEKFHDNEGQDVVMNHIIAADQVDAGIVPDVNASSTNFNYWKSKNILQESLHPGLLSNLPKHSKILPKWIVSSYLLKFTVGLRNNNVQALKK